jgi:hypothetical protein
MFIHLLMTVIWVAEEMMQRPVVEGTTDLSATVREEPGGGKPH